MTNSNGHGAIVGIGGVILVLVAGLLFWQSGQHGPVVPTAVAAADVPLTPVAPAAPSAAVPQGAAATGQDTMQLVIGGMPQPYTQRNPVPVVGNLIAEFAVVEGGARYVRAVDIYLYQGTRDQPYADANLVVSAQMRYMDHGYYTWAATPVGDGHYIISMPFNMPGEWKLTFELTDKGKKSSVVLDFDLLN